MMRFYYSYLSPPHQIFLNGSGLESNGFSLPLILGCSQISPLRRRTEKQPNASVALRHLWAWGFGRGREGRHQTVGPRTPVLSFAALFHLRLTLKGTVQISLATWVMRLGPVCWQEASLISPEPACM